MKNILVALELEGDAEVVLRKVEQIALQFRSKVWLMHIAAPDPDFVGYDAGPQSVRDIRAEELRQEHRELQQMAKDLMNKGIDANGLLVQGATVATIIEQAEKLKSDLILLGHQQHGFLYRLFAGSVSEEIARRSHVPVLLVPVSEQDLSDS